MHMYELHTVKTALGGSQKPFALKLGGLNSLSGRADPKELEKVLARRNHRRCHRRAAPPSGRAPSRRARAHRCHGAPLPQDAERERRGVREDL